ncbi:MAG: M20 family metallo-hydrolase [Aquamicrobium sp.]|uniref:M20 family metallo-hydrolase n=1 Tax=Aquamicrobium sp. TaxID=1872579 RepID=UPI00349EFEBE|nr:M20 family metallo-hydrolase [Aquamicrobium sp.]
MKNDQRRIPIHTERMMNDLDTMRGFGACGTGVVRPAFSEVDIRSRGWLVERMEAAGLEVHVDEIGNVFGLPPGDGPCFLVGSHSDTQPEGGWLDGVYGVVAGLEIARASLEAGGPRIACVSFQDEEGRFTPLTGSRVWTGRLAPETADALADSAGVTLAEARRNRDGLPPASAVSPDRFSGFLEIHIEQGPVLDIAGERIGVVESIVGIRSQRMSFVGEQNHAGTTPMAMRRDAFQALVAFTAEIGRRFAGMIGPATVWTIGQVALHPNATSIVPGRADFWLQWRDGDDALLDRMRDVIDATAGEVARDRGLSWSKSDYSQIAATRSDPALVEALAGAAEQLAPGAWRRMPSGALHDAANASTRMPMAMLFLPSIGGRSHCFDEDTRREDLVLGAEVLAAAIGTFLAPPAR